MAHDKGTFVDDANAHEGHIGAIVELVAVVEGELIRDGRAIIEEVVPADAIEELEYVHACDDQVLDGAGVV